MRRYLFLTLYVLLLSMASKSDAQRYSMVFEENKGQWDERALYRSIIPAGQVYLQKDGIRYFFINEEPIQDYLAHPPKPNLKFPVNVQSHVIAVDFVNANKEPKMETALQYSYYSNYFLGNDPSHWASKVHSFGLVRYKSLYEGIDLEYFGNGDKMKYQFRVAPQADPEKIELRYRGQEAITLFDGALLVRTSFNTFREEKPFCYQLVKGEQVEVEAAFVLDGNTIKYKIGAYDKSLPLVIDPVLVFCSYSGSSADNFGFTATYDDGGNFYAGGNVRDDVYLGGSGRYPATPGAFQTSFQGGGAPTGTPTNKGFPCDVAISKYDSSGENLVWATYLGGSLNDYPHSMIVDDQNQLVVFGTTFSTDFPVTKNAYDTLQNGRIDIYVTKLAFDGSALIGSTYIGGDHDDGFVEQGNTNADIKNKLVYNYADNYRGDVIISEQTKDIYIASATSSANFPVTLNAFQATKGDSIDGCIFQLDENLTQLKWSTFLGGQFEDALYSIKLNEIEDIYVAGGTRSTNLPTTTTAYRSSFSGGRADGYFARIHGSDKSLDYLSYFGGSSYDQIYFGDLDTKGRYYIFGQTESTLAMSPGVYGQANGGLFVSIFDSSLKTIQYQTTIGNMANVPNLSPTAFVVDFCDKVYMAGWGGNFNPYHVGTTSGLPVTSGAIKDSTDGEDFYLLVLDKNLQTDVYSTFFGGTESADHVDGGTSRFSKEGIVYHSICGSCSGPSVLLSDIATTPNAAFPTNSSPRCSNTSFKIDFQLKSAVKAQFSPSPKIACNPSTVKMNNFSRYGEDFIWNFGDGSAEDTTYDPSHTYTASGTYQIRLIAIDSSTCNIFDTAYKSIIVVDQGVADFEYEVDVCLQKVSFTSTSSNVINQFWEFGDGDTSSYPKPNHVYSKGGEYTVTLFINPGTLCADTIRKSVKIEDLGVDSIFIPNVFTPNGDAFNPCFKIEGLLDCDKIHVEIFDRWAIKVYETEDNNFCWDGTNERTGILLPAGVYYILVDLDLLGKGKRTYKGTITIIR